MARGHVRPRGTGFVYVIRHPALDRPEWSRQQPTRDAAERLMTARLAGLDKNLGVGGSKDTVEQFMTNWLAGRKKLRASSRANYRLAIEQLIVPYLGDVLLAKLRPDHIAAWHGKLAAAGKSAQRINYAQTVLTAGLRQAVKWNYIPRDPSLLVERPDVAEKEARWWTPEDARRFLDATEDARDGTLYRVTMAACLRYSEATALSWEDVDLKGKRIVVRRTWSRSGVKGLPWIATLPKDHEIRTVPIDDATVAALVRHKERQAFARARSDRWQDNDLVFPGRDGQMISAEMVRSRFRAAVKTAGVAELTFHGLRHTGATLLLRAGVPLVVVSRILGHASVAFTARVYLHVDEDMLDDAGEGMGRMLGGG